MVIKVDVDGVLRDMVGAILKIYNEEFGDSVTDEQVTDYDLDVSLPRIKSETGKTAREFLFLHNNDRVLAVTKYAEAYQGAKEAMEKLKEAGHNVIICTWQMRNLSRHGTLEFLRRNGIEYRSIFFSKDKHLVSGDIIIDDCPKFLDNDNSKVKIIIDRPYNRQAGDYTYRAQDITDAVNYILLRYGNGNK